MSLNVIDDTIQSWWPRMSISSRSVRVVCVTYSRPRSSNEMPIGSATIPSGAQRLSSSPGASGAEIDVRPACESFIAESGDSRTVVAVNGGTGTETSARAGAEVVTGAVDGSGTGTD